MSNDIECISAFPDSFALMTYQGDELLTPTEYARDLILAVNEDPDVFWLFPKNDQVILLPFLLGAKCEPKVIDSSGILSDYTLMLLTPPDVDDLSDGQWPLANLLSLKQKAFIAKMLESQEEWETDDLKYPNWVDREAYWTQFL